MADIKKQIVILGGSYGGMSTAHYVLKHVIPRLPSKADFEVVLVSASAEAMDRPACPRALISDEFFDQTKLFVNVAKQFEQYPAGSFRFIQGRATALDHRARTVTISVTADKSTQTLTFHALVIATGASTPSPLLGLNTDSDGLRASWASFRKQLPSAKSIVIGGGGPSGVEVAGELGEHLNGAACWWKSELANPVVQITVVNSASKILPQLRPAIAHKAEELLAKRGVRVVNNVAVTEVIEDEKKTTVKLSDGKTLEADIYIPCAGMSPNTDFVLDQATLLEADGRVKTNTSTLRVDAAGPGARIYAIGDASSYARPAVHNVLSAVPVLGANIRRDLLLAEGKEGTAGGSAGEEDKIFKEDKTETQLVPIGKSKGVGAAMGYRMPSVVVWAIKGRDYWLWTVGKLWSGEQWAKES